MPNFLKSEKLFLLSLALFNLLFRLISINSQTDPYLNEKYIVLPPVRDILSGLGDTNPISAPYPLAKSIIAFSIKIFGDNPYGWRVPSVLFSVLLITVVYLLAKEIFKSRRTAAIACILLTFETAVFVHSRSADPELMAITLMLLSLLFVWKTLNYNKIRWVIASGITFGLALTVKPSPIFPLMGALILILFFTKARLPNRILSAVLILAFASFIYLTAYIFAFRLAANLNDFIKLQLKINRHYSLNWPLHYYEALSKTEAGPRLPEFDKYLKYPILWLKNPKIPYYETNINNKKSLVLYFYNPLIFFPALATFLGGIFYATRVKRAKTGITFLAVISLFIYSPYLITSLYKPLAYAPYYLLPAIPLLVIILSFFLELLWQKTKFILILYLFIVIVTFAIHYPLLVAIPVPLNYFHFLTGLR